MDWKNAIFLHTGWAIRYDGTEEPKGGHAYLQQAIGVEAENFRPVDGWCYGYAPVSKRYKSGRTDKIPKGDRVLKIDKLGASPRQNEVAGITVIWTATKPGHGPVIVGLYRNATLFRYMPPDTPDYRPFVAKARLEDCILVPYADRVVEVPKGLKGFPGKQSAAWFPGEHQDGPARGFLVEVAGYMATLE